MKLINAIPYANRILELLQPHCYEIKIGGSVRRLREEVKDIEVVCLPKMIFTQTDLFGGGAWLVCPEFGNAVAQMMDRVIVGNLSGRMIQMMVKGHVKVDLFMPAPADYYRILAIRTGSYQYSQMVIAYAWKKMGWVGAGEHGLRRREDCIEVPNGEKTRWKLINPDGQLPPAWESEEEFFQWLGLEWIEPQYRELKHSLNQAQ